MIERFQRWRTERRRRRALREIRSTFALFGHDPSEFSDEDLERGAVSFGQAIARCGFSAEEVVEASRQVAIAAPSPDDWLRRARMAGGEE